MIKKMMKLKYKKNELNARDATPECMRVKPGPP